MTSQVTTLDGLPKQFVTAMRTLFDIMDDKRIGYVDFADIENRWQEGEDKGLPKGVVESLRKVTPPNGLLSFERFCAGLKISLLRSQVESRREGPAKPPADVGGMKVGSRPPSAPLLDIDAAPAQPQKPSWVAIRPNNVMGPQQRALSMPQLMAKEAGGIVVGNATGDNVDVPQQQAPKQPALYGPPKPPRSAIGLERTAVTGNMDRAEIRTALQNWQKVQMMTEHPDAQKAAPQPQYGVPAGGGLLRTAGGRSMGDGKASTTQNDAQQAATAATAPPPPQYQKKPNGRRREPRRHTLQNGIDYSMLKRMKQIEQEKEVLVQGLAAVEKARDWYLKQISSVQEKMKYLGRMGHVDHWSEAQQERLELQRARVLEVNRHLTALTESWERGGLPLHMNLAVHHYPQPQQPTHEINDRLKRQNRLLTEEVSKKSERISALEREKTNLIQLLQFRSAQQNRNGAQEEAVF